MTKKYVDYLVEVIEAFHKTSPGAVMLTEVHATALQAAAILYAADKLHNIKLLYRGMANND